MQAAVEIISFGGGGVLPIVSLDSSALGPAGTAPAAKKVGSGGPGPFFRRVADLVAADLRASPFLDKVPYEAFEPPTR